MIRLIQRRLIIPRGDTGSFSIPVLRDSADNIAVFTIFDEVSHTKILQKKVKSEGGLINIAFTHADTVNLKPGDYVWDIKYYSNPEYIDDELVNGEEIDSYYAGFSLPVCEIRETADNYLVSPEGPTATLSPEQLEIVTGAIHSLNEAIRKTQENVEHYPEIRDEVWYVWDAELGDYVSTDVRANGIVGNGIASAVLNDDYTLTLNFTDGTSFTSPSIRGQRGNGIEDIVLNNDFTLTITYTDGDSYVTPSIRGPVGATPQFSIGNVQDGAVAAASITGTAENPVLNLTLPNAHVPTKVSQLENDSGYLTQEVDPTVPQWAKQLTKPSYTPQEVGALPEDTYIPQKTSDLTNDSNYAVDANYVHTDNNYTTAEKNKLSGIAAGAEVNVNADWNANSGDAQILNKPTKVSAFTNDAGYLTEHQDISDKADKSEIPTKVSQLQNDSGYLTSYTETDPTVPAWAKAAQKPSYTAAEVGAPTVAEMNTAIGTAIGNINSFDIAVVQVLPTQDISTHTIYLIPKTGETNDVYDEYIYINSKWEMVGNTQIDLSNYVQKTDYATGTTAGVVKINQNFGIDILNGFLYMKNANANQIKTGTHATNPIVPSTQDSSVFYGLAKAAGDSTQSQSDNQVGQYTDDAKAAIQQMLDVPSTSDIPDTSIYVTKESIDNAGIFNREFIDISNGEQTVTTIDNGEKGISKDITDVVDTFSGQCLRITFDGVEYLFNTNYVVIEDTWSEPLFYSVGDITKVPAINEHLIVDYNDSAPFCLLNSNSQRLLFTEVAGTHTIKVEKQRRDITKISNELLYDNTASPAKYQLSGLQVRNSIGPNSIASNLLKGTAIGVANHVEGDGGVAIGARNTVSGIYSTAVGGWKNEASGAYAFTSGLMNTASGNDSVALGIQNVTSGQASFTIGRNNTASGKSSSALGENLIVNHLSQVAKGQFNKEDNSSAASTARGNYVEIVGNGTSANARSNAYALTWTGDGKYAGDVYVHANADSNGGTKLATIDDIPDVPVQDVQINGTSILRDGTANVPIASDHLGVVKANVYGNYGILIEDGEMLIVPASENAIKGGVNGNKPISPIRQHSAVFYGLAKAAGADMKNIANTTVGIYPDAQKEAIQSMLGISQMLAPTNSNLIAEQAYAIGDVFAANGHLYKATAAIAQDEAIIPDTNCVETNLVNESVRDVQVAGSSVVGSDGVANVPIAEQGQLGVVQLNRLYGISAFGNGFIGINRADANMVKAGIENNRPIVPSNNDAATFYGLSKVAGVDLKDETVTLGTYPETSKTAIKEMLGVQDGLKVVRLI